MCDETYYPWVPDNPADWDLIAAAPDMLEALEMIAKNLDGDMVQFEYDMVRAAIAKAKGQETK
jgi:hypothetical protein